MIEIYKIAINNGDFSPLLVDKDTVCNGEKYRLLHEYVEKTIVDDLNQYVGDRCDTVYIEYPYYDSDYLSNYYEFYSKKHKFFSKKCCRLLLFGQENFIGYISLRPTYSGRKVGRMCLSPRYCLLKSFNRQVPRSYKYVHPGKAFLIITKQKVHFDGEEFLVESVPHMTQEGDISVCAHISLWIILRMFSSRFRMYPEIRIGNLVQMIQPEAERLIPSHGLTVKQICNVLLKFELTPIVRKRVDSHVDSEQYFTSIVDEILAYIESGIPVIGIDSHDEHTVTVIGRGGLLPVGIQAPSNPRILDRWKDWWSGAEMNWDEKPEECKIYLSSRLVEEIVINDDNYFPYRFLATKHEKKFGNSTNSPFVSELNERNGLPPIRLNETAEKFDGVVVPLYSRIQLVYNDVLAFFQGSVVDGRYKGRNEMVARIYLTSSNTFREYIKSITPKIDEDHKKQWNEILRLELPKFVWVVETATCQQYLDGYIDTFMLIDSTSATVDLKADLYFFDSIAFMNGDEMMPLAIPRFDNNLSAE